MTDRAGVAPPRVDADVPAFWRSLGLPGLIDVHVHFMPQRVLDKVWSYFDSAGPLVGREWPINYRHPEQERLARLRSMGVRAFPSLVYPHKPGMAARLNGWAAQFAGRVPECLQTATFYPEPDAPSYVDAAVRAGARLFKVHVQVGDFDPRDPLLDAVWSTVADARVPVLVHAGSGPAPGRFTGPGPFGEVLARHPRLVAIIAHLGMPEYSGFFDQAARFDDVYLDTTGAFVDFFADDAPPTDLVVPRMRDLQERVLLGTDFPNISYPYAHQLEALVNLGLGDEWLRDVCWRNAAQLFDMGDLAGEQTSSA